MIKPVNILSVVQSLDSLSADQHRMFLDHHGVSIKDYEIRDLGTLIKCMSPSKPPISVFNDYYVGYKIPQIGKEFDLLRFGEQAVINVEIKGKADEAVILNQLHRNKYYLSFISSSVTLFSFVAETENLYTLNEQDQLEPVTFDALLKCVNNVGVQDVGNPDHIFNPSNYLVSPFNSTDVFIAGRYFLTQQQEDVKRKFFNSSETFVAIKGNAGTGKTLLIYDIAKSSLAKGNKTLIVHCGKLNQGHYNLVENGWDIRAIKYFKPELLTEYSLVVVDESQRIYESQFKELVKSVNQNGCRCIFSYDQAQTLATWEQNRKIDVKIETLNSLARYTLSKKIRTNKEVADFIRQFFDIHFNSGSTPTNSIEICYFDNIKDSKRYSLALADSEWELLRLTPSQHSKEYHQEYSELWLKNSHEVIGQEFDNVAVIVDQHFGYDENGKLSYKNKSYYHAPSMLFQNVTRTRRRLKIIIVDNDEILERCMTILKRNT